MKISNETKVGLLTVVALTILILGFNFLKGNNVFDRGKKIYAVFESIGSLETSNDVKVKGNSIGKVYAKRFTDKNATGILVTINLTSDINIPFNSVASIVSPLAGTPYIAIDLGDAQQYLTNGDTIQTKLNNGPFGDITSQVTSTLETLRPAIDSLKFVLGDLHRVFDTRAKNNIHVILDNLNAASLSLERMINPETSVLARSLSNVESITANIRKNNDSITSIISNANIAAGKLANLDIQSTIDSLQTVVLQIKSTVAKMNSKDGSLGLLLNDKQLYDNLQKAALGLEILIDDIRVHPKHYVNISIFGKKDKGNYLTSPAKKDTL